MDVVTALAAIRAKGLTEEADILEAAIDEALCDEPIVRMSSGVTADQIAETVVAKLLEHRQVAGAKLSQKPLPEGIPALPWELDSDGDAWSADGMLLLVHEEIGTEVSCENHGVDRIRTVSAIVEAMNGYYSPQTPSESAAANSETGIPDTAGYPLPEGLPQ